MKKLLALAALAALTALAARGDDKAGRKDNTPPEGFQALFDGKDLMDWQGEIQIDKRLKIGGQEQEAIQKATDGKILPHWKVEDGVLVNDGQGGNLATIRDYRDFELYVDWKIEPSGDSGIYLRGEPQVQIWDSDSLDPKKYPKDLGKGSGGLWNNKDHTNVPLKKADRPPGEWNTFHIVMKGDKVTVRLNDELVVDNVPLENIWERGKPLPEKGPIVLQQHQKQDGTRGKLWFKNIYIKELP
jgi:hypothetical protein